MTTMTYEEAVFLQGRRKYFDAGNRCNKRDIEGRRKKDSERERETETETERDAEKQAKAELGWNLFGISSICRIFSDHEPRHWEHKKNCVRSCRVLYDAKLWPTKHCLFGRCSLRYEAIKP